MNYVIRTGGKQYIVKSGDQIDVERTPEAVGDKISLEVLCTFDDKGAITVGKPLVTGKTLEAKVLDHFRGEKLRVFKYKRRKRYRKSKGHRQDVMSIEIL